MNHLNWKKWSLTICVAAFALVLSFGGDASAQSWFSPNLFGPQFPNLDIGSPGMGGTSLTAGGRSDDILYFSPRFYLTLGNPPNYFGLFDNGIAKMNTNPGVPELFFDGTANNLQTINAFDVELNVFTGPSDEYLYFSPREKILVTGENENFFVMPGDVAMMDLNTCIFMPYFKGHEISLYNVDACSIVHEDCENGEYLVFSPGQDWFYYTGGPGSPLFVREQDLASWDPNTGEIKLFLDGSDAGLYSLDGADVVVDDDENSTIYEIIFSVRIPQWVFPADGNPFFLGDGDVAELEKQNGALTEYEVELKGHFQHIYTIDGLAEIEPDKRE